MFSIAISNVFMSLCPSCVDIDASNIENVQLNCGEFAYLTAGLIYSDPEGRVTASTLLDRLLTWMLSQDNPSLVVNGLRVALSQQCPTQLNPATSDACINSVYDNTSLIIAGFFGGLVVGIVIMVSAYGLIYW